MTESARISIPLDLSAGGTARFIRRLVTESALFRRFARRPRETLQAEMAGLASTLQGDEELRDLVHTVRLARAHLRGRKGSPAVFDEIVRLGGTTVAAVSKIEAKTRTEVTTDGTTVKARTQAEIATKTARQRETEVAFKGRAAPDESLEQRRSLHSRRKLDFGPLIAPGVLEAVTSR